MNDIWNSTLSAPEVAATLAILRTLLAALMLGLIVGYERTYHGRAVGMRTYGLVCMSSAALTTFVGYPTLWYGGHAATAATVDPTRVVQGIVTGIGFLGAGIIMKDGFNTRGLTTAASVWAACVIGVLVGVGFYGSAILLSMLSLVCMMWVHRLEMWLPTRPGIAVVVRFCHGATPAPGSLEHAVAERGYEMVGGSLSIAMKDGLVEWHFAATSGSRGKHAPLTELAQLLCADARIDSFHLAHTRN
jgi:putative Mg2+ transporter-C (MgtC) family protein